MLKFSQYLRLGVLINEVLIKKKVHSWIRYCKVSMYIVIKNFHFYPSFWPAFSLCVILILKNMYFHSSLPSWDSTQVTSRLDNNNQCNRPFFHHRAKFDQFWHVFGQLSVTASLKSLKMAFIYTDTPFCVSTLNFNKSGLRFLK